MAAWKLTKALWTSDVEGLERFKVTQPRFNAADHPEDYLDVCADRAHTVCPYAPSMGAFSRENTNGATPQKAPGGALNERNLEFSDRLWRVV